MRATSSIRSASRVTSSRRQDGTVTSRPSPASLDAEPERARGCRPRPRAGPPRRAARSVRASRSRSVAGSGPGAADVDRAAAPAARRQLDHQLRRDGLAVDRLLGLELLLEAARRLGAQRRAGSTCAGCSARSRSPPPSARGWSRRCTSERAPPITPAIEVGPSASSITQHLGVERALDVVERGHRLAVARAADDERARRPRGRRRTRAAAGR